MIVCRSPERTFQTSVVRKSALQHFARKSIICVICTAYACTLYTTTISRLQQYASWMTLVQRKRNLYKKCHVRLGIPVSEDPLNMLSMCYKTTWAIRYNRN